MTLSWKTLPAALALCLAAAASLPAAADEAYRPIPRILAGGIADLAVLPDTEPQRVLVVVGEVMSGGWHDGQLERVTYAAFPHDGIQDLKAVAQPPDGMAAQVISRLILTLDAGNEPAELKGYRIHADEACVVVLIDRKVELPGEKCPILGREE